MATAKSLELSAYQKVDASTLGTQLQDQKSNYDISCETELAVSNTHRLLGSFRSSMARVSKTWHILFGTSTESF
jgi:hypothetical protein